MGVKNIGIGQPEIYSNPAYPRAFGEHDLGYLSDKKHERNRYLQPDEIVKLVICAQKTRGKYYLPAIILEQYSLENSSV